MRYLLNFSSIVCQSLRPGESAFVADHLRERMVFSVATARVGAQRMQAVRGAAVDVHASIERPKLNAGGQALTAAARAASAARPDMALMAPWLTGVRLPGSRARTRSVGYLAFALGVLDVDGVGM